MNPPKEDTKTVSERTPTTAEYASDYFTEEAEEEPEHLDICSMSINMQMIGEVPDMAADTPSSKQKGEVHLIVMFHKVIMIDHKWEDNTILDLPDLPIDLADTYYQRLAMNTPLICIQRKVGGKASKESDPLLHPDNLAGGTVDLLPLLLGAQELAVKVRLVTSEGIENGCKIKCIIRTPELIEDLHNLVPLMVTMISGHCLPPVKDGSFYNAAIALDGVVDPIPVNFGLALSSHDTEKVVYSTAASGGLMFSTAYPDIKDDKFIPPDVELKNTGLCKSAYWKSMYRLLVDPALLRERLESPLTIEIAAVPLSSKGAKVDVRGHYMGSIDAKVLLLPENTTTLTTVATLREFAVVELPEGVGNNMLGLPPASAKSSAKSAKSSAKSVKSGKSGKSGKTSGSDPIILVDQYGHIPYIVIKFDLLKPLVPKQTIPLLYEKLGFPTPPIEMPSYDLHLDPPPEDPTVDVRKIRAEGGALAVHRELSALACRGTVQMNQSIKRIAAHRLMSRVRTMLRQFAPGDCSYVTWQGIVTAQHSAARRAVTASFRPRPPPKRLSNRVAATRSRMAGDLRISSMHIENNLKVSQQHPRVLLCKALRCLEERHERDAKTYVLRALSSQAKNKFVLFLFAGIEFDKGEEFVTAAKAALHISVKGDYSDGTMRAIGWAALHSIYHNVDNDIHAAFLAVLKMRKCYELENTWKAMLQSWKETSGEEEIYWFPEEVETNNPMLVAAAFFLCLRCYSMTEKLLQCMEHGCATRGSRLGLTTKITPDVYYLRAASWVLRRQVDMALEITEEGVKRFGPCRILSQMRATCLSQMREWDGECSKALEEVDRAGAVVSPALLLQAAQHGMWSDPNWALQRAARAHKMSPSAQSALLIGRIYAKKGDVRLAERWAAAAVKYEPLLADGWAVLALLAMGDRQTEKARAMLRTAHQVGPISEDIGKQLRRVMRIVKIDALADTMTRNLCLCDYIRPGED